MTTSNATHIKTAAGIRINFTSAYRRVFDAYSNMQGARFLAMSEEDKETPDMELANEYWLDYDYWKEVFNRTNTLIERVEAMAA